MGKSWGENGTKLWCEWGNIGFRECWEECLGCEYTVVEKSIEHGGIWRLICLSKFEKNNKKKLKCLKKIE
jgi:hypothetical protein